MQRVVTTERGRLVWYRRAATSAYWARHWDRMLEAWDPYPSAVQGDLGPFEDVFTRHLQKRGLILEAGCGLGQLVIAMRQRGWEAEGVDYAKDTIEYVKRRFATLPVRYGDVTRLDVPDGYYSGYISIGVVEHLRDGPGPILREACRVLKPGGVALISVPHFNAVRRAKARLGCYQGPREAGEFYQYAFSSREFDLWLREAGFDVVEHVRYSGFKGLVDEFPSMATVMDLPYVGRRCRKLLLRSKLLDQLFGHMLMAVCRKRG